MPQISSGIRRIHHVAIVTRDLEKAIQHYVGVMHFQPGPVREVDRPGVRFRTAMLPVCAGADSFVQLIEPSEGPGCAELERSGEGTLLEVGFEVSNIEEFNGQMTEAGIHPVDISGQDITAPYLTSSFGNRYNFLRPADMLGTRTELIQVMPTPGKDV